MAADREYSKFQQGVIRRYYENRDSIAVQKLAEIVSNLYLQTSDRKRERAWESAHKQMLAAGVPERQAMTVLENQDLSALAKIVANFS